MVEPKVLEPLLDSLASGLVVADEQGEIVFLNRPARKMLGLGKAGGPGLALARVCPPLEPLARECLDRGSALPGREVGLGQELFRVETGPLAGADKGVLFTLSAKAPGPEEGSSRGSRLTIGQYESVFDLIEDGVWVADGKGDVLKTNRAAQEFLGLPGEALAGRNIGSLVEEGVIDKAATLEVLATRKQVNLIQQAKSKGKQLLLTGTPLFDGQGQIELVVVTERDVTQLNAINEELAQAQMMAERIRDELALVSTLQMKDQRLVAESEEMLRVLHLALKLSRISDFNILILGESGTGKGLLARYIHENSVRQEFPLIQINCAALPETLLEAELFGYEKGAFTGAREQGKVGLIELAQGGTLFLDEIGDCPLSIQSKLLKYLDDHEIFRLGGTASRKVDCSILAATNQDLSSLVRTGRFRRDLFYRLNTFTITVPPLRERPDDIIELSNYFLAKYNARYGLSGSLSPESRRLLQEHSFPGNVRELKGIVKKAVVINETAALEGVLSSEPRGRSGGGDSLDLKGRLDRLERRILLKARQKHKTTRAMAQRLGIDQSTVARKLKKHGL